MHTQSQTQAVTMMMEVQAMHTQAQTQAVTTGTRSVRELAPSPASTVKVDLHEVQQDATSPHACPTASDQPDLDASSEGTTHAYAISHPSASAFLSSLLEGTQPSEAAASPARSGLSPARSGLSPARTMLPCQFSACGRIKGAMRGYIVRRYHRYLLQPQAYTRRGHGYATHTAIASPGSPVAKEHYLGLLERLGLPVSASSSSKPFPVERDPPGQISSGDNEGCGAQTHAYLDRKPGGLSGTCLVNQLAESSQSCIA